MKLSIQKSFVVLLVLIGNFTVSGQRFFRINLNLYKPLAESRVAFEDSILTFYAPYKAGKETHFPLVYIHRQDYLNWRTEQRFLIMEDGVSKELNKAIILKYKDDTKNLVKIINDKINRKRTEGSIFLYAEKGLRMYDCNFEDNLSDKTFHLFLGSKSDSKTNHFANIEEIKKKISSILKDHSEAIINIHFSDRDKLCNGDDTYVNQSIKHLSYGELPSKSSLGQEEALEIVKQNWSTITEQISKDFEKDILIETVCERYYTDLNSENRIFFDVEFPTKHKHPTTGKYTNERGEYYLGTCLIQIELNRYGGFFSSSLKVMELPDFNDYKTKSNKSKTRQGDVVAEPEDYDEPAINQTEPEYPGGYEALYSEIYNNITYPKEYYKKDKGGTVYVSFIVEATGEISEIKVDRGVPDAPLFATEVVNAIKKLTKKFKPATSNGKPIRYSYRVPFKFAPRD
jgi:TonB family protein